MSRVIETRIMCDRCGYECGRTYGAEPSREKPDLCEPCKDAIADAILTTTNRSSVELLGLLVLDVERVVERWAERRKAQEGDR